ncbi:YerC/YecD family TrpR-related protein [Pseudomarimonas arenosa]|uniref:DNA-binding transcriptional regulator n=1 Tax=Pseudomarimonas arenosa TaxID=2774145 RepID=A0AAW3ZTH8_9GAMM|nr:YerC/YecD family TrpR-related protein [Pseudomarimonas arenosa]MBD8527692.1 DNA-binding transcriptional regulator [Pseudomarimonas arenosa]
MKRRSLTTDAAADNHLDTLCQVLAALDSPAQLKAFLTDLCTPAELEALTDRWRVVPLLLEGRSYRDIHDVSGVSVTTIGRVARCLGEGQGYRLAADAMHLPSHRPGLDTAQLDASNQ